MYCVKFEFEPLTFFISSNFLSFVMKLKRDNKVISISAKLFLGNRRSLEDINLFDIRTILLLVYHIPTKKMNVDYI